jgi:phosphohistidine phosphatase SixA
VIVFLVHRAPDAEAARALAWRLRWHDCTPTAIWTSPHDLAGMTAHVLVDVLGWHGPVEVPAGLGLAHGDPVALAAALERAARDAVVVLVGHEPTLTSLARLLAGGEALPSLAEGEALRLDDGEPRWRFTHDGAAPVPGHAWTR